MHVVTDEHAAQFLEDQNQPVRHEHLLQVLALIQEAEKPPFQQITQQHGQHEPDQKRCKETAAKRCTYDRRQGVSHVGTDHVEAAVRQIDDAHDAEDQGQPGRDQEQQQSVLQRVQTLDQEGRQVHRRVASG